MKIINNRAKIFNEWEFLTDGEELNYLNNVVFPDIIAFCRDSNFNAEFIQYICRLIDDSRTAYESTLDNDLLRTYLLSIEMVINERESETIHDYLAGFEPHSIQRRRILTDFCEVFNKSGLHPNGKKYLTLQESYFKPVMNALLILGYQPPSLWEKCLSYRVSILKAEGFKLNEQPFSQEHIDRYNSANKETAITDAVKKRNTLLKVKRNRVNVKLLPYDDLIINKVFSKKESKSSEDLS